jgi:hypothetical protein
MCVCPYSCLSYPACKKHPSFIALYCHEGPVCLYCIFPYDLNSIILWREEKVTEQKMCDKNHGTEQTQIVLN